ncbi:SusC/RagA family TonB-linked outer membrane protein [Chitinophaga ginsengisegetis]|uniref:SusC/RagA family TonB-linked outer membrane protein n=1 Tax=Chitinophaga ginsengisegetis TaxID=393003 RepID=UPI000DBA43D0|nr:SusC/RagA family TonB-linked outer membrane protein [Chitinophaga ginsengisegetis]MDR6566848.1 TonB-linked SusC/RagA family outer membrane protein [Chitinophaga ginsengisegetis]MDR6646578.1 TonB-linked SusC/RagA family outer membrane protein [Chitinophaga ginsengisegetis]MDR6652928.1 TonB-linked SusC/RagA family outer membrane protein [Chitinophaga ginsengisegetis]
MKKGFLLFAMLMAIIHLAYSQQRQVTGTVKGNDGNPVPFATIQVKGTTAGTTANDNGVFNLSVPGASTVLVIRSVGYKAQEITVGESSNLQVTLVADNKNLQEVVVTGLGLVREKKTVGYATSNFATEQINRVAPVSMMDGLSGKIAGAEISTTSGAPGASNKVILRGYSSLQGNNQPLYVVDGVPLNNDRPGSTVDGKGVNNGGYDFGNNANDINPNDIEAISILKGAAATAIYGSRAASGVVLITTKKGKSGGLKVDVASAATFSRVGMLPTMQEKFGQGWGGTFILSENGSWGPRLTGENREWGAPVDGVSLTKPFSFVEDNVRNYFTTGKELNNTIAVSGGNETSTFFLSYGNVYSDGILPTDADSYKRNTFSARASTKYGRFSASASFNYVNKNAKAVSTRSEAGLGSSLFEDIIQIPVDINISQFKDYKNKYYNVDNYFTPYAENPYYSLYENGNNLKSNRIFGNIDLKYGINDWLNVQWRLGADVTNAQSKTYKAKNRPSLDSWNDGNNVEGAQRQEDVGYVRENSDYRGEFNSDLLLTANKKLSSDFTIDGLIGFNVNQREGKIFSSAVKGLAIPGFYVISNSPNSPVSQTQEFRRRIYGLYGQATLGFREYLFLTVNARNDWSSTLPEKNNSYFYPAVNAAFILSEALKLDDRGVSFAKLRASWGKTGNDAGPYLTKTTLSTGQIIDLPFGTLDFPFNGIPGYTVGDNIGNPELAPELSNEYELGGEVKFLRNRLGFDIAYYNKLTKGQILAVPTTPSSGYASITQNFGKVRNKGIELSVNIIPVETKDFTWTMNYTYARNRNTVEELPAGLNQVVLNFAYDAKFVARKGDPLGVFYAPVPATTPDGKIIVDATGLPKAAETDGYYGTSQRDFTMGLVNTLRYKDLTLGFSFDWRKGGVFYSGTADLTYFVGNALLSTYNDRRAFVVPNSVMQIGTDAQAKPIYGENTIPLTDFNYDAYWYHTTNKGGAYSQRIIDKTYLKLRDITLSYSLPSSAARKIAASNLMLTVFARNMFVWTPEGNTFIDPEVSNYGNDLNSEFGEFRSMPTTKSYGVSLKVSF